MTASTAVTDAAVHVLLVRLGAVGEALTSARDHSSQDPEHVHQLRVATRRARAAIDIFAVCLPSKVYRRARRSLRDIRRTAGGVRDWDVFLEGLVQWPSAREARNRPGGDFLLGQAFGRREAALESLASSLEDHPFQFDRFMADTVSAVQKPDDGETRSLSDLAGPMLTSLMRELETTATKKPFDLESLHAARIIGKRLRYAMEVFADCFAEPFRNRLYPNIEEMQEILGNVNDSHVASVRVQEILDSLKTLASTQSKRLKPGLESFLKYHQDRISSEFTQFQKWWANWTANGGESAFLALLKEPTDDTGLPAQPAPSIIPAPDRTQTGT